MIEVKIIKDSIAPSNVRLTTFVLTYPRFIHSEFLTHRSFSRNASSSRAIPVKKQIELIETNPAIPLDFRKNKKGMQAGELIEDQEAAMKIWLDARDSAIKEAKRMLELDIAKQYVNRILEPFSHISVVCTATDWTNFFALRIHEAAQPEICELAKQMYNVYNNSVPDKLLYGQWHLPFVNYSHIENISLSNDILIKRSVAKCARVSYLNHDGTQSTEEQDLQLYDRLLGSKPIHASPAEHQAMAIKSSDIRSGNFRGWLQYRKLLMDENIKNFENIKQ